MKTAVYFPVSTTHYNSTLSLNIRRTKGWQGYGQYLAIQQMLANSKNRKLNLSEVPDIAFNLHISEEEVLNIINSYFSIEGQEFHSTELEEALLYFDAKYNAASLAGKKSAEAKTPEERKALAEKAAKTRWNKDANDSKTSASVEPKVLLQDDANTLAFVSIDAKKPQHNPNNNIKQNKTEEKETKEKKTEETNKEENKKERISSSESPSYFKFDSDKIFSIQEEINNYKSSKYFKDFNLSIVTNHYIEFRKQYVKTKITLSKFEQVLCYWLAALKPEELGINTYLHTNPVITPSSIQEVIVVINEHKEIQQQFEEFINSYVLHSST